jgi:hypothetical protein
MHLLYFFRHFVLFRHLEGVYLEGVDLDFNVRDSYYDFCENMYGASLIIA